MTVYITSVDNCITVLQSKERKITTLLWVYVTKGVHIHVNTGVS